MIPSSRFLCFALLAFCLITGSGNPPLGAKVSEDTPLGEGRLNLHLLTRLVARETNLFRAAHGRAALTISQSLGKAAQDHAQAMTRHHFFAHRNPYDPEQRELTDRMRRVGLRPQACAENIAMNFSRDFEPIRAWVKRGRRGESPEIPEQTYQAFARKVVQQWIDSRGHRANLLRADFSEIGLGFSSEEKGGGYDVVYCVQNFSSPPMAHAEDGRFPSIWN